MTSFQSTREQTEQKVLVRLLSEIDRNPAFTQRSLAGELGVALGLINQYLKSCVTKGWVRASQVAPNRWKYFITPDGLREKGHMVAGYLSRSMMFFREAKTQCDEALQYCAAHGLRKVGLVGQGDLADIFRLVAQRYDVVVGESLDDVDAAVVTDMVNPQGVFDVLQKQFDARQIITLPLLHVSLGEINK